MCCRYPRNTEFIESVEEEVQFQLTRLRKYTSITIWGGNNENENMMEQFVNATFFPPGESFNRDIAVADFSKLFVDVIYPIVKSLDPVRPFVDTSPSNGVYSYDPYVKRWGDSNSVAFGYGVVKVLSFPLPLILELTATVCSLVMCTSITMMATARTSRSTLPRDLSQSSDSRVRLQAQQCDM